MSKCTLSAGTNANLGLRLLPADLQQPRPPLFKDDSSWPEGAEALQTRISFDPKTRKCSADSFAAGGLEQSCLTGSKSGQDSNPKVVSQVLCSTLHKTNGPEQHFAGGAKEGPMQVHTPKSHTFLDPERARMSRPKKRAGFFDIGSCIVHRHRQAGCALFVRHLSCFSLRCVTSAFPQ